MADYWEGLFGSAQREPKPLTLADLHAAVARMAEMDAERARRVAEATHRFIESVPPHLRSDPLIAEMLMWVQSDQPIHPKDYENYKRRYEALVAGSDY